jgi:hypothetical protein
MLHKECGIYSNHGIIEGQRQKESGCLRPLGHLGPCLSKTDEGRYYTYEDDDSCSCRHCVYGEPADCCQVFREVKSAIDLQKLMYSADF